MTACSALAIPEIAGLVCSYVYRDSFQDPLDPPLITGRFKHTAVATLLALSRVNRLFHAEAIPYLYADVSIGLPASFEGFLGTVGVLQEEDDDRDGHIKQDDAASPTSSSSNCRPGRKSLPLYEERQGLLTPPSSRETSRDRDSPPPTNFFMPISITEASTRSANTQFATLWRKENPGLHISSISFEKFRSHGLRRTVKESSRQRFVTSDRLLQILRGTRGAGSILTRFDKNDHRENAASAILAVGKLSALGLTEYIDSSLNLDVLEEILLRGGTAFKHNPEQLHGSPLALKTQPIERLDLCGCVSRTFIEALAELREKYNLNANTSTHTDAQEKNNVTDPSTIFPHVKRLGLFNMILSQSLFIDFAMSFPNLTHLDLGNTRTNGQLLHLIGQSSTIRLKSLSLAKCTMLNSQSIRDFFLLSNSNVLQDLEELNLYYEGTLSIPLIKEHLKDILEYSIPFNSGKLKYLDLSTSPLDDELLENYFAKQQPHLLDLGLANCPNITWKGLSKFLEEKAFNVEVLDIRGSCRQILFPTSPTQGRVARRNDVLLNTIVGVHQYLVKLPITSTTKTSSTSTSSSSSSNKTKLRVIELDEKVLEAIDEANANPNWKVFFGKSYRGWYVNCTIHIDPITNERIHEQMDKSDKRSKNLFDLAGKSKSGGLNFGWHSRKMSVLGDDGMLGREHGLYNFHAFA